MEIFKKIEGFGDDYLISDSGKLYKIKNGIIIKQLGIPRTKGSHNYTHVVLYKNGKRHEFALHRLTAMVFIPNPEKLPCVNHKDGNKHNNNVENLEWVSFSRNMTHAVEKGLFKKNKIVKSMERFSFQKGYGQIKKKDEKIVREKIMKALGLNTSPSWYQRLYGNVEPKVSEAEAIEAIFKEFGVTNVWGV